MPPTNAVVAARCGELLNALGSTLPADLRLLAAADADMFPDIGRYRQLLQYYSEVAPYASPSLDAPYEPVGLTPCAHNCVEWLFSCGVPCAGTTNACWCTAGEAR